MRRARCGRALRGPRGAGLVVLPGFEPGTSCVSSKRSGPTELQDQRLQGTSRFEVERSARFELATIYLEGRRSDQTELRPHERQGEWPGAADGARGRQQRWAGRGGAPGRIRTCGQRIRSPLLCPLSYERQTMSLR